jgi:hypothetical protein
MNCYRHRKKCGGSWDADDFPRYEQAWCFSGDLYDFTSGSVAERFV